MNLYETTFIINPQTDDATIDRHVREVADVINKGQGKIHHEDHMGTRRLAYEIQDLTQGYYASFIFEAPTSVLPKLQRHFKLNEYYLRYLTVRFEGNLEKLIRPAEEQAQSPKEKPAAPKDESDIDVGKGSEESLETAESPETEKIQTVETEAVEPEATDESETETPGDDAAEEQEL
ncbi:MAG: 30S ribosomal protein S6 [Candidatus Zixiibacteriota bacterium]|nr:MAG: 30S ribosomal protein S6 [candidate division Zixibacteria bacterium]